MRKQYLTAILVLLTSTIFGQSSLLDDVPDIITNTSASMYEYLPKTIQRNGRYIEMWIKELPQNNVQKFRKAQIDLAKKSKWNLTGFDKLDHIKSKFECNCRNKTYRIVESIYYDVNGEVIKDYNMPYVEWSNVVPESVGQQLYEFACNFKF